MTRPARPLAIPPPAEALLNEARPADALEAVARFSWADPPRYHMFARRIGKWSTAAAVRADLATFGRA